jgi:PhnB protein
MTLHSGICCIWALFLEFFFLASFIPGKSMFFSWFRYCFIIVVLINPKQIISHMVRDTKPTEFQTRFAPMLLHKDGVAAIAFYQAAFGARELQRWSNDDGTIHVAELSIDGAVFHLREESKQEGQFSPISILGCTCIVELFVEDPQGLAARAEAAGARVLNPVKDREETGYCQGTLIDPFGHRWSLLRKIKK